MREPVEALTSLETKSLNLASLMQDDQIEQELTQIMEQPNLDARVDKALEMLMDHFDVDNQVTRMLIKGNFETLFHQLSKIVPNFYEPYSP